MVSFQHDAVVRVSHCRCAVIQHYTFATLTVQVSSSVSRRPRPGSQGPAGSPAAGGWGTSWGHRGTLEKPPETPAQAQHTGPSGRTLHSSRRGHRPGQLATTLGSVASWHRLAPG